MDDFALSGVNPNIPLLVEIIQKLDQYVALSNTYK